MGEGAFSLFNGLLNPFPGCYRIREKNGRPEGKEEEEEGTPRS